MSVQSPSSKPRRYLARIGLLACLAFVGATLLVWSARWFWLGEVATAFAWPLGLAGLVGALALLAVRLVRLALVTAVIALAHVVPEAWLYVGAGCAGHAQPAVAHADTFHVVTCNRLAGADNHAALWERLDALAVEQGVGAEGFDVIAIQEGNATFLATLDGVAERYPYQIFAPPRADWHALTFGTVILSRWPIVASHEYPMPPGHERGPHEAVIDWMGTRVTVRNVHPMRPGKPWRIALREQVLGVLESLDWSGASILCGDLNMTSASPAFGDLLAATDLADTRQGFGRQPTYTVKTRVGSLGVPIDHILASDAWCVLERRVFDIPKSDHDGVVVKLALHREADAPR